MGEKQAMMTGEIIENREGCSRSLPDDRPTAPLLSDSLPRASS